MVEVGPPEPQLLWRERTGDSSLLGSKKGEQEVIRNSCGVGRMGAGGGS